MPLIFLPIIEKELKRHRRPRRAAGDAKGEVADPGTPAARRGPACEPEGADERPPGAGDHPRGWRRLTRER
jgi:hypothetical protein